MGGVVGYNLGVDLGTTFVAAAIANDSQVEMFTLGDRTVVSPAVVYVREDGTLVCGDAAARRAVSNPDRIGREFKRRLGDPTPVMLGGAPFPVTTLLGALLENVIARVTETEGAKPGDVVLTHPANWGPFRRELFDEVPQVAGLTAPRTVTEPEAAAAHYAASRHLADGEIIAVYDLGGGTFDATVLRKYQGGIEILGVPEGIERLGGIDFDESILSFVNYASGGALAELDMGDPQTTVALARLRQDCILAKEALSIDSETTIPVFLPHRHFDVRLTRADFEDMIRAPIESTIGTLARTLQSAQVEPGRLSAVLLVGGSSRIPLVSRMISEELGRPTVVDAHPKYAVALGAAAIARSLAPADAPAPPVAPPTPGARPTDAAAPPAAPAIPTQRTAHPAPTPVSNPADIGTPPRPTPAGGSGDVIPPWPEPAATTSGPQPAAAAEVPPPTPPARRGPPPLPPPSSAPRRWDRRRLLTAAGAAVVLLALVAGVGTFAASRLGQQAEVPVPAMSAPPVPLPPIAPAEPAPAAAVAVPIPSIGPSVRVGETPGFVVVSPNGRQAYVANRAAGLITVVDTAINRVTATIPVPAGPPQFMAFAPDGRRIYVSVFNEARTIAAVSVLDTTTNSIVATIPVRTRPYLAAVTWDGSRVYVPNHDSGTISLIDTTTLTVLSEIKVAPNPHWVEFSKDGTRAYVANHESNVVSVLDTATNAILAEVPVEKSPHSVAVHPTRPLVANVNYDAASVTMIDTNTNQVVSTIKVGANPQDITWSPDGRFAYTADVNGNSVSVISADTMTVTATIPTGNSPTSVAVLPNGTTGYVTNLEDGTLTLLNLTV